MNTRSEENGSIQTNAEDNRRRVLGELSTYLDELAQGVPAHKPDSSGASAYVRDVVDQAEWLGEIIDDEREQAQNLANGVFSKPDDGIQNNPLTESFEVIRANLAASYAIANSAVTGDLDNIAIDAKNEFLKRVDDAVEALRKQRQSLEHNAFTDFLTDLGNRAAFNRDLDRLWEIGHSHTVAFIDIDGLKYCNDHFGHFEGNQYIAEVAKCLRLHARPNEGAYRLGGDEFVFLSPDATEDELAERLEACRELLQNNGTIDDGFAYTFSYGCAHADPQSGDSRTQLMVEADKRMYSYKLQHATNGRKQSYLPPLDDHRGIQDRIFQALADTAEGRYLFICDLDEDLSRWSRNAVRDFGLPSDVMHKMGDVWLTHIHPDDRAAWENDIDEIFRAKKHHHAMTYRAKDASGRYAMVTCTGVRIDGEGDEPSLFVGTIVNRSISDGTDPATGLDDVRALSLEIGERRQSRLATDLVAVKVGGLAEINSVHGYDAGNGALVQITDRILARIAGMGKLYRSYGLQFVAVLEGGEVENLAAFSVELQKLLEKLVHVQGFSVELPVVTAASRYDRIETQPLSVLSDLNRRIDAAVRASGNVLLSGENPFMRLSERNITNVGNVDNLTGLPRSSEFLRQASKYAHEHPIDKRCIACIDLGHLRVFNEWYGRSKGDSLLAEVGVVLHGICDKVGGCAGYWGQDDFTVYVPNNPDVIDAIYNRVESIVVSRDDSVGFLPSMGVCPLDCGTDVRIADYDKAKFALEQAKADFKDRIRYFKPEDYHQLEEEHLLLAQFQHALSTGRVFFYVQPQYDMVEGRVVGGEALARWRRLDGTFLSPAVFVPLLERNGFIALLDRHIWNEVFAWIASGIERGLNVVPMSINVSQIDILSLDVAECLEKLVRRHNVPTNLIKVEITESAYVGDDGAVQTLVRKLKTLGFSVYMDDFGSGTSSLSMLKDVSVDVVKLDGNFMDEERGQGNKGSTIVESVVDMVRSINLPIIVEGVETSEQVEFLKGLGCRYVQGFYFYKPMSVADFEDLISDASKVDVRGITAVR